MTMRSAILASALGLLGATSFGAQAETENLALDNSTLENAQDLGSIGTDDAINVFGLRGSVEIFGTLFADDGKPDFYAFAVGANQLITLSVSADSGPETDDDPVVGLFDAGGNLLLTDDDGGPGFDSLLSHFVSAPGVYYAAVSGYADFDFDGVGDFDELVLPSTDWIYHLQISSAAPVPVPAAGWLLGSALLGLIARRRKA